MTTPEAMLNAGRRIAAIASGRAFAEAGQAQGSDPAPAETPEPSTEPANPNNPPEPGRQDEGQQTG
jgi:hypothetical protein